MEEEKAPTAKTDGKETLQDLPNQSTSIAYRHIYSI